MEMVKEIMELQKQGKFVFLTEEGWKEIVRLIGEHSESNDTQEKVG